MNNPHFPCAALIKEIGRGAHGARPLPRETADELYSAMLEGRVSDVELGAILIAYRIKGETPEELAGMLSAAHRQLVPVALAAGPYRPVSIPSYNGARKLPNLTPLRALLLARRGVPVVVHGVRTDAARVTSAQIFEALGRPVAASANDAAASLASDRLCFLPIDVLSPGLARLLQLRSVLGVRSSTHTLVKLLDPFAGANALAVAQSSGAPGASLTRATVRLVNYTHPPYRDSLAGLFGAFPDIASGDVLLARGTEGEAVADTRRQVQVDWLHNGQAETLLAAVRSDPDAEPPSLPASLDAAITADWINRAMAGEIEIPQAIARQVEEIVRISGRP
jgi:anthranilate phosphoribosyltransferase